MQVSRKTYIVFMTIYIAKVLKYKYIQQNAKKGQKGHITYIP